MNTEEVRLFAEAAYGDLKYGPWPYTYHLTHVALIALRFGHEDEEILKACWLHDLLEDTDLTQDDLREVGIEESVINIVECVTDGPGINRKERKSTMYPKCLANDKAVIVKLCDRIANVEEAIKTRSKTYRMYLKEMPDFEKNLRTEGKFDDMWEYLNKLIYKVN